jgi:ubiquinone/menaquinone biosynthesis C-methylase UbiE
MWHIVACRGTQSAPGPRRAEQLGTRFFLPAGGSDNNNNRAGCMNVKAEQKSLEALPPQAIPSYLQDTYWWAYVHPNAVSFFERQWLVNLILWGNFARLRDAALAELGGEVSGRTLQVACVYGNFSEHLAARIAPGGSLDIVDVLPIQLSNMRKKLPASAPVTLHQRDSTALGFDDASYDQAIIFFLLHEQPAAARRQTLREALRVVKPGGKLVLVD